jgi:EmrB/QacA subfamily drug resistance transporter
MSDLQTKTAVTAHRDAAPAAMPALTVLLVSLAYFMVTLDALVVVTALPSIHRQFGGSLATLQWTVSAYNTTYPAGILTAAALGDRLGRRRVFLGGLLLFAVASALCAVAPDAATLIAFRTLQGLGAAAVMPTGLTLLTSAFPIEKRGAVVGIWGGVAGLGVATGPLVGGVVTQGLSWHWIFWVNVPVGLLVFAGARLRLGESYGPRNPLDLVGLVAVTVGVGAAVWAIVDGQQDGWASPQVLLAFVAAAALLSSFVVRQARSATPMIPLWLFRSGRFSVAVLTQFATGAAIFSAAFLTSEYFQFGRGDSPLAAGLRFLPWTATPLLISPLAGALYDRVGARRLVVPGLLMQAAGFAWIVHLAGEHAGYGAFVLPFVVAGVGISMTLPCIPAAGLNSVPPAWLGKASGVLNMTQLLGATAGVAVTTIVFDAHGSLFDAASATSGYRPALAVAASFSAAGALLALGLRRARVQRDDPGQDVR